MADIPLRTYVEQIDNLVEKKQIDEAIAHCKHILTYYPKHLGTYQALGKALLEKGRHADAADIFKRVLSAVPDDYVSHIGMSIVCEDQGNTEGALWHMERAFEVMPSNPAIQDELRRLYGRRDGLMPPRTRLTRGALARMYVKGGLFAQAEAELKKALADAPDRLDLTTVLAQVYWQTNRRQEAADTCVSLVEKQPYNQEANRMLADILLAQGRTAELVPYRQRLEALDPYAAFADPNTDGHGPAPKAEAILIPKLDYTPDMAASAAGTPDWVTSIGATLEQPSHAQAPATPDWLPETLSTQTEVAHAAELPDWLQGAQVALTSQPSQAPAQTPGPLPSAEGDMPDWMKTAVTTPLDMPDWMKAPPATEAEAAPAVDENADWAAATVSTADIPDWMKGMAPASETAAPASEAPALAFAAPTAPADAPSPAAMSEDEALHWLEGLALQQGARPDEMVTQPQIPATPAANEAVPDWLKPPAPEAAAAAPVPEEIPEWLKASVPAQELPAWMQESPAAEGAPAVAEAAPPAETPALDVGNLGEEDALRWMEKLALQQGAKAEEMVSPPLAAPAEPVAAVSTPEAVPDWLKAIPTEEVPAWMQPPATEAAPAEELPAWMQTPAAEAAPAEELPAWMQTPAAEAAPAEELPAWMQTPAAEAAPAEELPAWMQTPAAEAAPAEELPAWMQAQPATPEPAPMAEADATSPLVAAELPDWLKTMETAAPAEELPDWLKEQAPATAEEEAAPMAAAELPSWLPAAIPAAAAVPAEADEKPDWLKQMEAEADAYDASLSVAPAEAAPAQPATFAETVPAMPTAEAEKPDWLKQMEAEADTYEASLTGAPVAPAEPQPAAEAEKPDWLKQMEAEADTYEASVAPATPEPAAKAKLRPDELPDFLQMATAEAVERSEQPTHLADELELEQTAEPEEPALAAAEIPDWLKSFSPVAAEPEVAPQPAETIQWLESTPDMPTLTPAEPAAPAEPSDELPEWIQQPAEKAEPAPLAELPNWVQEPTPGPSETVSLWLAKKKIPDWLRNPDEEAQVQPSVDWLHAPAEETPKPPAAEPPTPPAKAKGTDELTTAFLGATDTANEPPAALAQPVAPAEVNEDEALRWLENVAQQQEPSAQPEEHLAVAAEMPPMPEAPAEPARPAEEPPTPPATIEELVTKPLDQLPAWLTLDILDIASPEPAPAVAAAPPVAETPAAPAAMDDDEALRWLENLAVQQGARPDELVTKPEERLTQPPAWITAETQAATAETLAAAAETQAAPVAEEPIPPASSTTGQEFVTRPLGELPSWLASETPEPSAVEPPVTPAEPAAMSDDEALRWLESLAVQQGARPEELVTKPEDRLAQPPAWVAAETQAATAAETQAAAAPETQAAAAPETQAAEAEATVVAETEAAATTTFETGAIPESAPAPAEPAAMSDDEALRWLESLAVQQGARPEELVTKPEDRLAQPPAWVAAETQAAETEAAAVAETEAAATTTFETGTIPESAPAPAEPAAMSDDEALRWLEGLAVQQGARPEELVTKPEDRLAQPPAWVAAETQAAAAPKTQAAEAEATVVAETEAAATTTFETSAIPESAPAPAEPAAMSDDEALRWLESLAVQQGARPEELVTKPEDRLAQPPAWVAAETQAAAAAETQAAVAAEMQAPAPEAAAAITETAAAATFEPSRAAPEAPAEPAAMSDDEALRWLESLAAQQGARPEELVTKPEDRLSQPPAWITAESEAAAAAETLAVPAETEAHEPELPTLSFTRVSPEPEPPQPPAAAETGQARDARLSKLAEKLAAGRRAKDAEIEARFESKRAEQEAARRAVQQKLERKPPAPEAAPEQVTPPVPTVVTPVAPAVAATAKPKPVRAARPTAVAKPPRAPAAPKPKKVKLSKSPYAAEAPETVLAQARQQLGEGEHDPAAERLAYLVASNQLLPNTISELEAFTAQQYSAPLLQILGDAYMKTNQLQKALETYRQALGHL